MLADRAGIGATAVPAIARFQQCRLVMFAMARSQPSQWYAPASGCPLSQRKPLNFSHWNWAAMRTWHEETGA